MCLMCSLFRYSFLINKQMNLLTSYNEFWVIFKKWGNCDPELENKIHIPSYLNVIVLIQLTYYLMTVSLLFAHRLILLCTLPYKGLLRHWVLVPFACWFSSSPLESTNTHVTFEILVLCKTVLLSPWPLLDKETIHITVSRKAVV